jgi:amidase
VNKPSKYDAPLVQQLKNAGAIPFAKTNVPWHLAHHEPSNPIIGVTKSNLKGEISFGGRAGGLAVLLSKCNCNSLVSCLIGFGTDQAGGGRVPANHIGVYALKPTSNRIGYATKEGVWDLLSSVTTPMSKDLDSILFVFQVLSSPNTQREYSRQPPIPFRDMLYESCLVDRKLTLGYYVDDGIIRACPTAKRAVFKAVQALHEQGHNVVRFQPPCPKKALLMLLKLYCLNKGHPKCWDQMGLRELGKAIPYGYTQYIPGFIKVNALRLLGWLVNDPLLIQLVNSFGGSSTRTKSRALDELLELEIEKEEYERMFSICWQQPDIDVVICPVEATPPLPNISNYFHWVGNFYSSLYNFLDYPSGVVPGLATVGSGDSIPNAVQFAHHDRYNGIGVHHFNFIGVAALEETNFWYVKGDIRDLEIGVQVVGKPFEEEKVLAVMKLITNATK